MAVQLQVTPWTTIKLFFACVSGAACLYYLNTGKKRHDVNRLMWGAICGLLTALIFAL